MKRILLLCMVLLPLIGATAQNHLKFKGIPIAGNVNDFCQELIDKGFETVETVNHSDLLEGYFIGRKVKVMIESTYDGKNVFAVTVILEAEEDWNTLFNTYKYCKGLYTKKYSEPSKCTEHKINLSRNLLIQQIKEGRVVYRCVWEQPQGDILLNIAEYGSNDGCVVIKYTDKQSYNIKVNQELDDI